MNLSIIIPVVNEVHNLLHLIPDIWSKAFHPDSLEIIVVDGKSKDNPTEKLSQFQISILNSDKRQRAYQMNLGAKKARGKVYYFLHADSKLPKGFDDKILDACKTSDSGCYQMKFDSQSPILAFYSFFTRFSAGIFHGGDASLFVKREVFHQLNGYDEACDIMEDYEINYRLIKDYSFKVLPDYLVTSARRYEKNGIIKLQWHYLILQIMYRTGVKQEKLLNYFKRNII